MPLASLGTRATIKARVWSKCRGKDGGVTLESVFTMIISGERTSECPMPHSLSSVRTADLIMKGRQPSSRSLSVLRFE